MTDEKINIAIAEACGWTFEKFNVRDPEGHRLSYVCGLGRDKERYNVENAAEAIKRGLIPDYCNDLNVMHEAEKVVRALPEKRITYAHYLMNLAGDAYHATARQRAEAFVKTLNLKTT